MPVHPQTITTAFREARELAGITAGANQTPPTFHELRSLGIRLYKQQGYDPQALAGHKDAATTAIYTDSRGAEWIDVKAS
jgi:enterobacteria phage integrase